MNSVASPEEIVNLALDAIGYPQSIGDLYEGTLAARVAVRWYAQTRDAALRSKDWSFAERTVALTLTGFPAPAPWLFEFAFPGDCLRVRQIYPNPPGNFPVLDPRPQLFANINDTLNFSPPRQVIVANISPASMTYTGQVLDPSQWDANFVERLMSMLARRFAIALKQEAQLVPLTQKLAEIAEDTALGSQANEPPTPIMQRAPERSQQ